jgi:single stranded DNA-binding protein (ssb)
MNKVFLIGNLLKIRSLRTLVRALQYANSPWRFRVVFLTARARGKRTFLPIIVWRAQAEHCNKYLKKGSKAAVSGSVQTRSYDANDGTRRYITEIVADEVQFLSTRNEIESSDEGGGVFDDLQAVDENLPF